VVGLGRGLSDSRCRRPRCLLTSRTDLPLPGHDLSSVDSDRDALTVVKLPGFHEEILVVVSGGELRADHSFALAGRRFRTRR
jgi:hypothetical protein